MPSGIFIRSDSIYYWLRFYDKTIEEKSKRAASISTKILVTPADRKRYEESRGTGTKPKIVGNSDLQRFVKAFNEGLHEKIINKKTGVRLIKSKKFSEAAEEYLYYKTRPGDPKKYRTRTILLYKKAVEHFIAAAGDKEIRKYSKRVDYYALLEYFEKNGIRQNSAAIYIRALRPIWNYFIKEKLVSENIMDKIQSEEAEPAPIPLEEMFRILIYFRENKENPHYFHVLYFMLLTGCRPSSAIVQLKENIFFKEKYIQIENVKTGARKGKKLYQFPLYPELERLLKSMNVQSGEKGRLFPEFSFSDGYYTSSLRFWERGIKVLALAKKISHAYTLKQIRSTFASFLVNVLKLDIFYVQRLLDHANIKVTEQHYTKLEIQSLRRELEDIEFSSFFPG